MCVILFAPPKKQIKERFLYNAFKNNPDGAGIMYYTEDGKVNFKKGFMFYDEMLSFWNKLNIDLPRALHCRIATSGMVNKQNCHPFIITDRIKEMQKTKGVSDTGCMMHNGVLTDYTPAQGMKSNYSDTMVFNQKVLYPIVKSNSIENEGVKDLIDKLGSCFLLFLPDFKTYMFGNFTEDKDGFFASNISYSYDKHYYGYDLGYCYDYGYDDYLDYDFIQNVLPRYENILEFYEDTNEQYPLYKLDDLVDDLGDFIICPSEPFSTMEEIKNGVFQCQLSTYEKIDGLLSKDFKLINTKKIDKDV